jgi:hypothetical protein
VACHSKFSVVDPHSDCWPVLTGEWRRLGFLIARKVGRLKSTQALESRLALVPSKARAGTHKWAGRSRPVQTEQEAVLKNISIALCCDAILVKEGNGAASGICSRTTQ